MSRASSKPCVPARLGMGFRWLLASSWASNLGDGLMMAAGPLLVASQTHNPLLVARRRRGRSSCRGCCSDWWPGRWPTGWTGA